MACPVCHNEDHWGDVPPRRRRYPEVCPHPDAARKETQRSGCDPGPSIVCTECGLTID